MRTKTIKCNVKNVLFFVDTFTHLVQFPIGLNKYEVAALAAINTNVQILDNKIFYENRLLQVAVLAGNCFIYLLAMPFTWLSLLVLNLYNISRM